MAVHGLQQVGAEGRPAIRSRTSRICPNLCIQPCMRHEISSKLLCLVKAVKEVNSWRDRATPALVVRSSGDFICTLETENKSNSAYGFLLVGQCLLHVCAQQRTCVCMCLQIQDVFISVRYAPQHSSSRTRKVLLISKLASTSCIVSVYAFRRPLCF